MYFSSKAYVTAYEFRQCISFHMICTITELMFRTKCVWLNLVGKVVIYNANKYFLSQLPITHVYLASEKYLHMENVSYKCTQFKRTEISMNY